MRLAVSQLSGIIVYEFRMHWRRRSLLVITLTMTVITAALALVTASEVGQGSVRQLIDRLVQEQGVRGAEVLTFTILFATWAPVGAALAFVLPILVADTIPLDQQLGTRELLDSLPLSIGVYLIGKTAGVFVAAIAGIVFALAVTAVSWRLAVGPYDLISYLQMWLLGGGTLVALNGTLAALLAAGQPTRRRAVVLVILVWGLAMVTVGGALTGDGGVASYLSPVRGPIIMRYTRFDAYSSTPVMFFSADMAQGLAIGLIEVALVAIVVWAWMRRRAQRA